MKRDFINEHTVTENVQMFRLPPHQMSNLSGIFSCLIPVLIFLFLINTISFIVTFPSFIFDNKVLSKHTSAYLSATVHIHAYERVFCIYVINSI